MRFNQCVVAQLCAFLISVAFSSHASAGECAVWENLKKAREQADATAAAFSNVVIPEVIEDKIEAAIARKLIDSPGMSIKTALAQVEQELSFEEQALLAPWLAARKLRDLADDAYAKADQAYREELNKKDAALKPAEQAFEAEQKWLEAEKDAIKDMPRDDKYLDRVSAITKRLRAAYEKMRGDLGGFRDCFPDVRKFLDDKEERLMRIDQVEEEIARRRGKNAGDGAVAGNPGDDKKVDGDAQQVVPGEPPPPGPLGDVWVCDGPTISAKQGKLTSVSEDGFTYEKEVDGQKFQAGVKISKKPPKRVRIYERVEIVMSAFGEPKAPVDANWAPNNVIAGQIPSDNACSNIPKFKGVGDSSTATVRFYFGAGLNPHIRMYGGEYDSRDGTRVDIYWHYRKAE